MAKGFAWRARQEGVSRDEFAAFYAGSKDRCLRAARASGLSPDRAEDGVAEAFARAWARWPTVRNLEAPGAWVVRTAVNADISWWRRRRHEVAGEPRDVASAGLDPDDPAALVAAISVLPRRQREVVVHRYLLDLDTATTARALGIAPGTVAAHLHHALANLRSHLTTEGSPS